MNQRLEELMLEAGYAAPELAGRAKKLAELIVKEGADIAKHNVMNISTYADAAFVEEQIKQYFGVEE